MTLLTDQQIAMPADRTYHAYVPDNPVADQLPAIIVFHGGGQDVEVIARRWGIAPPNPVPALVEDYILVFPVSHPDLGERWIHHRKASYGSLPELDLRFVGALLDEITAPGAFTSANGDPVAADPERIYASGFSNGSGMAWQLAYSNPAMVDRFAGFAMVASALVPDKVEWYRNRFGAPTPKPLMYVHGTADTSYTSPRTLLEIPMDTSYSGFTVQEMLDRNGVGPGTPATTQLVSGSTGVTEVVLQQWTGTEAFSQVTVINGGHNWPTPNNAANPPVADHFNATRAIVEFWQANAGLP